MFFDTTKIPKKVYIVKVHDLKILPPFFEEVIAGRKTFEMRFDDRGYAVGDIVLLHEWEHGQYSGRRVSAKITYILRGFRGLKRRWVVFSFQIYGSTGVTE